MKNNEKQQARDMYLQSGLTKEQIGAKLGVSRRTIYQWSVDGDWDTLRASARHMPAMLAQKCYYLIGHFTDHLLQRDRSEESVTKSEVDALHKLVVTVQKLKTTSTVNENMQTLTLLQERIAAKDPDLAEDLTPHLQSFIYARSRVKEGDFMLSGFDQDGYLSDSSKEHEEQRLDEEDAAALLEEIYGKEAAASRPAAPQPAPAKSPQAAPAAKAPAAKAPAPQHNPKPFANHYRSHIQAQAETRKSQPEDTKVHRAA